MELEEYSFVIENLGIFVSVYNTISDTLNLLKNNNIICSFDWDVAKSGFVITCYPSKIINAILNLNTSIADRKCSIKLTGTSSIKSTEQTNNNTTSKSEEQTSKTVEKNSLALFIRKIPKIITFAQARINKFDVIEFKNVDITVVFDSNNGYFINDYTKPGYKQIHTTTAEDAINQIWDITVAHFVPKV